MSFALCIMPLVDFKQFKNRILALLQETFDIINVYRIYRSETSSD